VGLHVLRDIRALLTSCLLKEASGQPLELLQLHKFVERSFSTVRLTSSAVLTSLQREASQQLELLLQHSQTLWLQFCSKNGSLKMASKDSLRHTTELLQLWLMTDHALQDFCIILYLCSFRLQSVLKGFNSKLQHLNIKKRERGSLSQYHNIEAAAQCLTPTHPAHHRFPTTKTWNMQRGQRIHCICICSRN
jgi:hypothetical protein